jgi:hypothetical protein
MNYLVIVLASVLLGTSSSGAQQASVRSSVNTLEELGSALWSCWTPPPDTQNFQVTVRFSFKRTGEVLGTPRIAYSTFNGSEDEQRWIMQRILASLDACTPLNVTPALGGAIAGRIFTMTFTSPSTRV